MKYTQFIEKLINDKKELSLKCEEQTKKLIEKDKELKNAEEDLIKKSSISLYEQENEKLKTQEFKLKLVELQKQNASYRERIIKSEPLYIILKFFY